MPRLCLRTNPVPLILLVLLLFLPGTLFGQSSSPPLRNQVYFLFESAGQWGNAPLLYGFSYERTLTPSFGLRSKVEWLVQNSKYQSEYLGDTEANYRTTRERDEAMFFWDSGLSLLLAWYPDRDSRVYPSFALGPRLEWERTTSTYSGFDVYSGVSSDREDVGNNLVVGLEALFGMHFSISPQLNLHASWGMEMAVRRFSFDTDFSGRTIGSEERLIVDSDDSSEESSLHTTNIALGVEFRF